MSNLSFLGKSVGSRNNPNELRENKIILDWLRIKLYADYQESSGAVGGSSPPGVQGSKTAGWELYGMAGTRTNLQSSLASSESVANPSAPSQTEGSATSQQDIIESWPRGDLVEYCCAVAVAEVSHFTRAAQRLHMDQSAVSRHILKLESKLGIKLFARGGRGVELTDAGRAFVPLARKSLSAARAGERLAQAITSGQPEELEVAYSSIVDVHLIAQIKGLVESARPRTRVRFHSVPGEKLASRLLDGASHAAIGILPIQHELAEVCIFREKLFVALPTAHRLAQRRQVRASDLADDPVIWALGAANSPLSRHLTGLFRRAGYAPSAMRQAQCISEALGLVREGFGVAIVKASELRLHPEGLAMRPFVEPYLVVETGLLFLGEHRWDLLKEFISLVTHHLHCAEPRAAS